MLFLVSMCTCECIELCWFLVVLVWVATPEYCFSPLCCCRLHYFIRLLLLVIVWARVLVLLADVLICVLRFLIFCVFASFPGNQGRVTYQELRLSIRSCFLLMVSDRVQSAGRIVFKWSCLLSFAWSRWGGWAYFHSRLERDARKVCQLFLT